MAHNPVNHPARPIYRAIGGLTGLYLVVFGVLGIVAIDGNEVFGQGTRVLGQGTNLGCSSLIVCSADRPGRHGGRPQHRRGGQQVPRRTPDGARPADARVHPHRRQRPQLQHRPPSSWMLPASCCSWPACTARSAPATSGSVREGRLVSEQDERASRTGSTIGVWRTIRSTIQLGPLYRVLAGLVGVLHPGLRHLGLVRTWRRRPLRPEQRLGARAADQPRVRAACR